MNIMTAKNLLVLVLTVFWLATAGAAAELSEFLPLSAEVNNWEVTDTRNIRSDNQLYDYIDGGAEVYRAFNFRRLAVRTFYGGDDVELIVELYAFKNPADAYGIFTMLPAGEILPLGNSGGYDSGILRFWKGPYYCKVFVSGDWTHYRDIILKAGSAVDAKIDETGEPPEIVSLMPQKDRAKEGLHYFHENISLKNLVYISPLNFLRLNRKTNVVMGRFFNLKAENIFLLLVEYASDQDCAEAYEYVVTDFIRAEIPAEGCHLRAILEPVRHVEIDREGKYLLVGFEDVQSELLSARLKELKINLTEYLKGK